jgi:AmiR/NasT family two-component response regulator
MLDMEIMASDDNLENVTVEDFVTYVAEEANRIRPDVYQVAIQYERRHSVGKWTVALCNETSDACVIYGFGETLLDAASRAIDDLARRLDK